MTKLRLPREYYLKRAVECYEQIGDLRAAAATLAAFGTPATSADAARRFLALGDDAAAGEAFLAAQQPRAALACFQRAGRQEQALACLHALDDAAAAGALLLALGRPAEATPLLERALAAAQEPAEQATLHLQLARALGEDAAAQGHYRAGLALLPQLAATPASADAWAALGDWGLALGRQDRMQEGYAQALRLLDAVRPAERWREIATRYRAAAHTIGNRRLVQILDAQLAERAAAPAAASPDPARALLDAGDWDAALAELEPRAHAGDESAKLLLVELIEGPPLPALTAAGAQPGERAFAPLPQRLHAAELLGTLGDPRLLDPRSGNSAVGNYWCAIAAGPFWYGDDRENTPLQQMTLPYAFRIGRYPVTNAEYRQFIDAGGYSEREWWTENGWNDKGNQTQPYMWDDELYSQPNQPVVRVSWYEAVAYCAWLTAQGRAAGWLPAEAELRLPTSLEWERAVRHTDQRRYPWGDDAPDAERANYLDTGIDRPTAVGCFPAGAAVDGAFDMAGNVSEWLATANTEPQAGEPQKDFTPSDSVLMTWSYYGAEVEQIGCGARFRYNPDFGDYDQGFRIVWSLALGG